MSTQKFQAESVMDALQVVQREMGPDALVLSVREIPGGPAWQVWRHPMVEVVAQINDGLNDSLPQEEALQPEPFEVQKKVNGNKEPVRWQPPVYHRSSKPDGDSVKKTVAQAGFTVKSEKEVSIVKPVFPYAGSQSNAKQNKKDLPDPTSRTTPDKYNEKPQPADQNKVEQADASFVSPKPKPPVVSNGLVNMTQRLLNQGLDEKVVRRLVTTCAGSLSPAALEDTARCQAYFKQTLSVGLREQHKLLATVPNRIMVLVGASGSGKTSAVARLAAHYSRSLGKKVLWISADTIRTGGISESRTYADVLSIPIQFVYTPEELAGVVEVAMQDEKVDLILVDTPGFNPCSETQLIELGGLLTRLPKRMTYLVAPATTKDSDLNQMAASLSPFTLHGLIVTKLDETFSYGNIYNFALHSQIPLAYFTNGKQVLGDFHLADVASLVDALFGEGWITRGKLQ